MEQNTAEMDAFISRTQEVMEHPWAAVERGLVWTLDSTDLSRPIKKFPNQPWLREYTEVWMRSPLFAGPKTRRMMISWLMVWNHLWLAMFHPGAHVYFQSETEKKSDELVGRAGFIFDHFPEGEIALPQPKPGKNNATTSWCSLAFPKLHSFIEGIPQGANALRQYTASAVFLDECSFWEKGRESFAATKPTIEGGGRVTLVSSAQRGWFHDLCYDTIE